MSQEMAVINTSMTIEELANFENGTIDLLRSIGINPSRHATETVEHFCDKKGWDDEQLLGWIKNNQKLFKKEIRLSGIKEWCNHLEKKYLCIVNESTEDILLNFFNKKTHMGEKYQGFDDIMSNAEYFLRNIQYYNQFSNQRLFPLLIQLEEKKEKMLYGDLKSLKKGLKIVKRDRQNLLQVINKLDKETSYSQNSGYHNQSTSTLIPELNKISNLTKQQLLLEENTFYPLIDYTIKSLKI